MNQTVAAEPHAKEGAKRMTDGHGGGRREKPDGAWPTAAMSNAPRAGLAAGNAGGTAALGGNAALPPHAGYFRPVTAPPIKPPGLPGTKKKQFFNGMNTVDINRTFLQPPHASPIKE